MLCPAVGAFLVYVSFSFKKRLFIRGFKGENIENIFYRKYGWI